MSRPDLRTASPSLRLTLERVSPSAGTTLPAVPADRPLTLSRYAASSFSLLPPPVSRWASSRVVVVNCGIAMRGLPSSICITPQGRRVQVSSRPVPTNRGRENRHMVVIGSQDPSGHDPPRPCPEALWGEFNGNDIGNCRGTPNRRRWYTSLPVLGCPLAMALPTESAAIA